MRKKIEGVLNKFGHEYEIDTDGNVFNVGTGRKLKQRPLKNKGYLRVGLPNGDKRIHRLVAEIFIPNDNPENKTHVNHKNGIKTDNRACNLEWVTPSENLKHAYDLGLTSMKGELNSNAKLSSKDVEEIRNSKESAATLSEKYGVTATHIKRILNNDMWEENDKAL